VEYARESVKKGATALGITYDNGVLLAIDKNIESPLLKPESIEKIFKIDDHIAAATSGLIADARRLIDFARETAQQEKFVYSEPISVELLTRQVCDLKQAYTQFGGGRPFGAALLIIGCDDTGAQLFETDPSGAFRGLYATSIGSGKKAVDEVLEKKYKPGMSLDDAIALAIESLKKAGDKKITPEGIDIMLIDNKRRKNEPVSKSDLEKHIKKAQAK